MRCDPGSGFFDRLRGIQTRGARDSDGQAAAELAFVLFFVSLLVLMLVQAALIVRDHVVVVHAARDAVREVSVGRADGEVREIVASMLTRTEVVIEHAQEVGDPVRVTIRHDAPTDVPIIGPFLPDLTITHTATMRSQT